jgi:hypothetical protein
MVFFLLFFFFFFFFFSLFFEGYCLPAFIWCVILVETLQPACASRRQISFGIRLFLPLSIHLHGGCCHHLGLLTVPLCHLKPPCAAPGEARLVIGLFEISNETIAYYLFLFVYCRFRLGFVVGVPTPLWLFDPIVTFSPLLNRKKKNEFLPCILGCSP